LLASSFWWVIFEIGFNIIHLGIIRIAGRLSYYASSMHGIFKSWILIPTFGYLSYYSWQFLALEF
jgi:hypothetical protein